MKRLILAAMISAALVSGAVEAQTIVTQLKPPPAPAGFPRFSASSYPYLWISGTAADGNIAGVVVYYEPCSGRGCHQTQWGAIVEWDWSGVPTYIGTCPDVIHWAATCPKRAPTGPYEVIGGSTFFPMLNNGSLDAGAIGNGSFIINDGVN